MKKPIVLIVEDNPISARLASEALHTTYDVRLCNSGKSAIAFCENETPDLILMDINMPGLDGLSACKLLKSNNRTTHVPVIFLTGDASIDVENDAWDAGCNDFIVKPFLQKTLQNRLRFHVQAKLMNDQLKLSASIDGLTGVYNRHYLDECLAEQILLSKRDKTPLGLLMFDIDYFKQFNDTYGHLHGDECLRNLSRAVQNCLTRPTDHIARYGGEEFVVVLPNTDLLGLERVANKIQTAINALNMSHSHSPFKIVTVSMGGISAYGSALTSVDLLSLVDQQLYFAKDGGRNRININTTRYYPQDTHVGQVLN